MIPPVWTWDAVTTDCHGAPESAIVYLVTQLQTAPAGYRRDCAPDEAGVEVCIDNALYTPVVIVAQDLVEAPEFPDAAVVAPPRGGVTFLDVEAIDEAGNVSGGEVCQ